MNPNISPERMVFGARIITVMLEVDSLLSSANNMQDEFESINDLRVQLGRVKKELEAVLDYNFYPEELAKIGRV